MKLELNTVITKDEEETVRLGFEFAKKIKRGAIIALYGTLGSGKTEFIKGIAQFFEVDEIVTSPTFTIINQYNGYLDGEEILIYHIDLYRIKSAQELAEIGFSECLSSPESIKLIEWSEKAPNLKLEANYSIDIALNQENENERTFTITKLD